ncbi:glycosyltransferase family 4 protein [Corynebacterium choanae]|uniref:GDP-mannose-dependent alpha-(1-2)-phosphatidylinositol mannosyltransferase n=1 Tax=Corynebacterium choanae TaxID=1862358 RepID=A0A3G6JB11_9CORY|nr:glycosyltransferase family 4 protein [Corynebacterium choanae]AZA13710.1 GDP-mannose-dependent alpha-(1-2)-phosphatidylinositol mannosyltransferase [Corynebacterium choanae]
MRIGIVCPYSFDEPGGVQAHVLDMAKFLRSQGHYVRVLGPATAAATVPDFVQRGGGSVAVPYNGSVARLSIGPKVRQQVKTFLQEGQFDVLHVHEPNSPSYSLAALLLAQGPIVATFHTSGDASTLLKIAKPVLTPLLEKIRAGIAVSEMARRFQMLQLGGDPVVIPNGVDIAPFAAARHQHAHRAAAATATNPLQVCFLGRLDEPRKGLDVLLQALEFVQCPVAVTVMGAGTARPHPQVTYLGRVSDAQKAAVLAASDVYCAPNTGGESFGIVLVEAMAAGACVLASDLEAFRAVTGAASKQPAGMLFPTGDPHALAASLDRLASDWQLRHRLRAGGVQRAQEFDWSVVGQRVLAVYSTVAGYEKVRLA